VDGRGAKAVGAGGEVAHKPTSGARTLARGFDVLQAVGARADGATVAEVCSDTGLDRAVVHRLLTTLVERGMVVRDGASRRFRLGVALVELGGQATRQLDVRRAAQASLRTLTDGTQESTCLTVRHGGDAVVVDCLDAGGGSGRAPLPVGSRLRLAHVGRGRAILAFSPDAQSVGATRRGASAMAHGEARQEAIASARHRGFSLGWDDIEPGLVEVAAPVRDAHGTAVGAVGVIAPASRLPHPARLGPRVRTVAQEVSRRLGAQ
jgi:DNA-binding IclR family transcriptional regulator